MSPGRQAWLTTTLPRSGAGYSAAQAKPAAEHVESVLLYFMYDNK